MTEQLDGFLIASEQPLQKGAVCMAAMPFEDLLRRWSNEDISADMVIGHVIRHLVRLHTTADTLNRAIARLYGEVEDRVPYKELKTSSQPKQ